MAPVSVVCLNWRNYLGRGDEYVEKLRNMVRRNLTLEHEFRVFTENDFNAATNESINKRGNGWWAKLCLPFMGLHPDRCTLYLDLDVVITQNIDSLVLLGRDGWGKLWMRDDFSYSIVNPRKDIGPDMHATLAGVGTCNSSVMMWSLPFSKHMYMADDFPDAHGDQNILTAAYWSIGKIGLLPNAMIGSYKYHVMRGEKPAPIVVFHGKPKPHEVRADWVREHWQ